MANFDVTAVSADLQTAFANEITKLNELDVAAKEALATSASLADVSDPVVVADDAEFIALLGAAQASYTVTTSADAGLVADLPSLLSGTTLPPLLAVTGTIALLLLQPLTPDLATAGTVELADAAELHEAINLLDDRYLYLDFASLTINDDDKALIQYQDAVLKQVLIGRVSAQTDSTGLVITVTNQTAADGLVDEFIRLLKRKK